jgi:hypothetical protein
MIEAQEMLGVGDEAMWHGPWQKRRDVRCFEMLVVNVPKREETKECSD